MKELKYFLILLMVLNFSGCADMDAPTPAQIVKNPIGPAAAKVGMSRSEVLSLYGDPDMKSYVKAPGWVSEREEWFYKATMSGLPVGADYLSNDLYLYFDGDNLTNISREPLGKEESGQQDESQASIK